VSTSTRVYLIYAYLAHRKDRWLPRPAPRRSDCGPLLVWVRDGSAPRRATVPTDLLNRPRPTRRLSRGARASMSAAYLRRVPICPTTSDGTGARKRSTIERAQAAKAAILRWMDGLHTLTTHFPTGPRTSGCPSPARMPTYHRRAEPRNHVARSAESLCVRRVRARAASPRPSSEPGRAGLRSRASCLAVERRPTGSSVRPSSDGWAFQPGTRQSTRARDRACPMPFTPSMY
jgi:hypothetical protein